MAETDPKNSDLPAALRKAAAELAKQINDATQLRVETRWVEIAADASDDQFKPEDARLAARTEINLDGDTVMIVPMRNQGGVLVRDNELLELHLGSVEKAIEYRKELLGTIIRTVQQLRER